MGSVREKRLAEGLCTHEAARGKKPNFPVQPYFRPDFL